ncbi:outer membrane-specific lipoprotein transporter subunit; ATP-binding component of ABC superfamily [Desulfamplus magnetovallimortis]|uniref:Outer membrane-specific lipoprotein transporter subunit ATP-binding component of ABC superfamily n=1 Tax=Desulfamplus magnetovallimortis TaxID=1246637 RepID=A0A1W1H4T6_9BACT|nr:ABC transporter ATP-binding protein [Desulfamplus magnetovallimortis]SLM27452.1 outer membrane-specific lipoprotein transporter subunit; ATP-binding component of ABC superfamily [Desulfamplus magnetovallimortis]
MVNKRPWPDSSILPMISMKGIAKRFSSATSEIEILKDVNFDIYSGESIAVVGASGTGKSTLLHILGTLDRPDTGELFFGDEKPFSMGSDELARFRNRRIGFVFQFHHLLQGFTAIENVMIPCLIQKISRKKSYAASAHILERVGLKSRLSHRAEDLSGGEQQRVALARAIVLKPDILLADEPTGNLDVQNSDQIHKLLVELNLELDMTIMVVTHNSALAELMSKKVTIKNFQIAEAR